MDKVSIIISARGEKAENLNRTINSIFQNATGNFEVIIGFNGLPYSTLLDHPKIKYHFEKENIGLKPMINKLASLATGKYLYKSDAHCAFSYGFDEALQQDMDDDWVVTPRFYVLDGKTWEWQDERFYDYFYLCCPFTDKRGLRFKAGGHWPERTQERLNTQYMGAKIDETPQIHGSGWFVKRDYFLEVLKFPEQDPFGHAQEPIWLGLRNWLLGGKVMVNKNAWYAHLHQDSSERGYPEDKKATEETYRETARYWLNDREHNLKYKFSWFVEKFMPMPTWPENWRELLNNFRKEAN